MIISEAFKLFDFYILQGKENRREKTRTNYRTACNSFIRACGDTHVELIGEDTVLLWKIDMQQRGNVASSVASDLRKLKKVLEYCAAKKMRTMDASHIDIPKTPRYKKNYTWLTPEEVEITIQAAKNARDKAIVACLFHTGSRISAMLSINREQYEDSPTDEDGIKEVWVEDKGERPSRLYLNKTAQGYINAYLATRSDPFKPLFISGQRRRITVSRVEQIVHEIREITGIKKILTPHVYRHSFASDLAVNGANLKAMQILLNHSNIQVTADIYSHFTDRQQKQTFKQYHTH